MYLLVREEPSRVALHPDRALVVDVEDKASLDQRRNPWAVGEKRWIPEPESRAFPKTPDQRSLRESPGTFDFETQNWPAVARIAPWSELEKGANRGFDGDVCSRFATDEEGGSVEA